MAVAVSRRKYKVRPAIERFFKYVEEPDETEDVCWTWAGNKTHGGYGVFWTGERQTVAHKFAYEYFVGPVPSKLDLDHECHNRDLSCPGGVTCQHRACVNPDHLKPATRSQNLRNSGRTGGLRPGGYHETQLAKTHCPSGHEYTPENVYSPPSRPTARYCRVCHNEHTRSRRRKFVESGLNTHGKKYARAS